MKPTKVHGVDGAASPPRPTTGATPTSGPASGTTPAATARSSGATADDGAAATTTAVAATTTTGAPAPTTPAGATTFAAYFDALRARFAGKDPRRLKGAVAKAGARVVLVLKEDADVRRATIVVGGVDVAGNDGTRRVDGDDRGCAGARVVVVAGPLAGAMKAREAGAKQQGGA